MNTVVYFDTSALAKWYINEEQSDAVEDSLQAHGPVAISDLTVIEIRCLLARRTRDKDISLEIEAEVFAAFQEDIRKGFLVCHAFPRGLAPGTVNLISLLHPIPLRTLDAMHLMIAQEIAAAELATCDRIMAEGAKAIGMGVIRFG